MLINTAENNWLGNNIVFYNEKTGKISTNMSEVIDYSNIEIDEEGLWNYFEFGYSAFGYTIIKNVRYLMPNEGIRRNANGKIELYQLDDPIMKDIHKKSTVKDTLEYMEYVIAQAAKNTKDDIVLPLSGGYDSRLLAYFIPFAQRDKVKCFTYGISKKQEESIEVVNAKYIAEKNNFEWKQIELKKFFDMIDEWIKIYNVSVHAHGMYHMEFYNQIQRQNIRGSVLSGVIGDLWSGNVEVSMIKSPGDLKMLGYSHGISIPTKYYKLKCKQNYREEFFERYRQELLDHDWRIVWVGRIKMMLLRYLYEIPQRMGFDTETPFLEYDLCLKMLNLPWEEKKNRKWQAEFLEKVNMQNVKNEHNSIDYANMLDLQCLKNVSLEPLNVNILKDYISIDFLEKINSYIYRTPILYRVDKNRILNAGKYFTLWKGYDEKILQALNAYLILIPLQKLLEKVR